MNKNAVGYIRVSSEEQVKNFSLGTQLKKCKEYCKSNETHLVRVFRDEGKSATSINRPALLELLDYCKLNKGSVDYCVIYKIDRMSRSTYDYLEIKRRLAAYGVTITSITEPTDNSPTGEFLETLMAAQARLDNAIKSERTKDGMTERLELGLPTNPVPVGYKYAPWKDGKSIPVPDEPAFSYLKQAGYEYIKGIYTKKQISDKLIEIGFKTKKGKLPSSQFVSNFLKNPFYKGIIVSKVRKKTYKGAYEAMFTNEEWYKIQEISSDKSFTAKPRKRNNPEFPLRHFSICGLCGKHITASPTKGNGGRYSYYRCPNHKPSVPIATFEKEFVEILESIKPSKDTVESFTALLKSKYNDAYRKLTSETRILEKELEKLRHQRKILVQKNLTGIYDDELFCEQDEELKNKIVVKKVQISESSMEKLDIDTICDFANHFLNNIAQTWRKADLATKQRLQEIIFPEGVQYCFPGFRTTVLSCLFNVLMDYDASDERLG
ncbi:recombinase family protein [bacterium]|nr:recombinase family protein [bacterium]